MDIAGRFERCTDPDMPADLFRSEVSHIYKKLPPKDFLKGALESDIVGKLWERHRYYYAFFVLAYIDYVSDMLSLGLFPGYEGYRASRLEKLAIPAGVMLKERLGFAGTLDAAIEECRNDPLGKYFYRFNILYKED